MCLFSSLETNSTPHDTRGITTFVQPKTKNPFISLSQNSRQEKWIFPFKRLKLQNLTLKEVHHFKMTNSQK
jgi:hypothetical protein